MLLDGYSAEVISRPGQLGDVYYPALEIHLKSFSSPYTLTLALPAVVCRALAEQLDPLSLYTAIANAINRANDGAKRPFNTLPEHSQVRGL